MKENLQRIKYITLFKYTQFRAVFRTWLNYLRWRDFRKNFHCRCSTGFKILLWMDDPVHNNLESYKVLLQAPFTTSKTELGYGV